MQADGQAVGNTSGAAGDRAENEVICRSRLIFAINDATTHPCRQTHRYLYAHTMQTNRQIYRQTQTQMRKQTETVRWKTSACFNFAFIRSFLYSFCLLLIGSQAGRQADKQTDRRTD